MQLILKKRYNRLLISEPFSGQNNSPVDIVMVIIPTFKQLKKEKKKLKCDQMFLTHFSFWNLRRREKLPFISESLIDR